MFGTFGWTKEYSIGSDSKITMANQFDLLLRKLGANIGRIQYDVVVTKRMVF